MKKAWIIGALFFLLTALNAKEVVGKYISYEQWAESCEISFQIKGKEKVFEACYPHQEILEKHKNELVRIKYSDDKYETLKNIYFIDGSNALGEKTINAKFVRYNKKQHRASYYTFEVGGKEINFLGYHLNITPTKKDKGKVFHIVYTGDSDNLKLISDISLAFEEAIRRPKIRNSSQKGKTLENKKTMELLRTFAIDESANYNMYNWATGTNNDSPIDWNYAGIKEALTYNGKPRADYPYKREGVATIENNAKWNITLLGARSGYLVVEIDSGITSHNPAKLILEKKHILEENHCEESASYNTSRYLIKFENKKLFWLQEMFSSGSGGGSYFYTILYNNKPKCETGI